MFNEKYLPTSSARILTVDSTAPTDAESTVCKNRMTMWPGLNVHLPTKILTADFTAPPDAESTVLTSTTQFEQPDLLPVVPEENTKDETVIIVKVASIIAKKFIFRNDSTGLFYYDPDAGTYKILEPSSSYSTGFGRFLRNNISQRYLYCLKKSVVWGVYTWLREYEKFSLPMNEKNISGANLVNGIFNLQTGIKVEHSPAYCFKYNINANYVANAQLSEVSKAFFTNLGCDAAGATQILAALGFALSNYRGLQKALFMYGPSRNGKSTFSNFIWKILPAGAVRGLNSRDLGNAFAPANLAKSQISVATDMATDKWSRAAVERFKQVVAGDFFEGQEKGVQHTTIKVYTFLMFLSNFPPKISRQDDPEGAVKRRMWLIKTGPTVPDERLDTGLINKLLADRDAIVSVALDTATKFLKQRELIAVNADEDFYAAELTEPDDLIYDFFKGHIMYTGREEDFILVTTLFGRFLDLYSDADAARTMKVTGFSKRLKKFITSGQIAKRNGRSALIMYALKKEEGKSDAQ